MVEDCSTCRLLMGITLSEMGGAQKVVFHLLEALPQEQYEITVACRPGGELLQWILELNQRRERPIKVAELPMMEREISPWADLVTFVQLVRLLRKGQYDVAHFHSSKMGILGRLAAKVARVPKVLFTVHGWGVNDHQAPWKRWVLGLAEKLAGRFSRRIVCVSEYDLKVGRARGFIPEGKGLVIYNGVPVISQTPGALRSELGLSNSICLFGMVGRLAEAKHPELVLKSVQELVKQRCFGFHVVFMGDGPLLGVCAQLVQEYGIGQYVTLLGNREDARRLMTDLDGLLLLSRYEGFPLVVLEAMQAAIPVLATAVGGVPEQVLDGETGRLVEPDPTKVAEALRFFIENPAVRKHMGELGRRRSELFGLQAMVRAYDHLYLGRRLESGGR